MTFEKLRAEAKTCSKPRLKEIYQEIADEIMAAIAKLEPKGNRNRSSNSAGFGSRIETEKWKSKSEKAETEK